MSQHIQWMAYMLECKIFPGVNIGHMSWAKGGSSLIIVWPSKRICATRKDCREGRRKPRNRRWSSHASRTKDADLTKWKQGWNHALPFIRLQAQVRSPSSRQIITVFPPSPTDICQKHHQLISFKNSGLSELVSE